VKISIKRSHIDISYPDIKASKRRRVEDVLNAHVRDRVCSMLQRQDINLIDFEKIIGTYRIVHNRRGVLSIIFEYVSCLDGLRSSNCIMSSLNANLGNGSLYVLKDLFKAESDYIQRIHTYIRGYLQSRGIDIEENDFIVNEDGFYIEEEGIVVFPERTSSERDGLLQILIPYIYLIDIIEERGPLAKVIV
jgi:hypothetical protein